MQPPRPSKNKRMRFAAAAALLFSFESLIAQVQNYNFAQNSGTWVPITTGTMLFSGSFDDGVSGPITIAPFIFNGNTYTQIWVSTNGFLTFGSAPTATNYTPLSSTETYAGAAAPFGANLASAATGPTNIRWRNLGYQVVVQWNNVRRVGQAETFSFQASLNRYTGVIKFIYGPITGPSASTTNFPQVGLRGPDNSFANQVDNRRVETGNQNWDHSLPGNNVNSTCRFTSASPAKYWELGQTYRYRHPQGGMGCEPPFLALTVNTNCAGSTFSLSVDMETIGDANNVTISTVPASNVYANVGAGVYTFGPFAFGTVVVLNAVNNSDANCGEQITNITEETCDCTGTPGGAALPGTACDDGNTCTVNDVYQANCSCAGQFIDSDGDGSADVCDGCPNDANKIAPGVCGCGVADTDSDNDGTANCIDGCPNDANKIAPGTCGCGVSDADSDGDLTADCIDGCPGDPNKTAPGQCGCGVVDADTDEDGICDAFDTCPGLFGEVGDACDDGNAATVDDVIDETCTCSGNACSVNIFLVFQTDGASNIGWELREQGTNILMQSGGGVYPLSQGYGITTCLPLGCFYLVVTDDGGDGIANGGYILRIQDGKRLIDNRNNFSTGSVSQIAGGQGFCLPVGSGRLIFTSMDKLDWKLSPCGGEFMVANDAPQVTAEYGVNDANSGYEAWWFDPNGGYSFRRFQSHSTANGFPAGPTRACHFRLNGWSGNQLLQGKLYNVKIRHRVNGVNEEWGGASRLMIDDVAAQCPRSKLMDIPDSPFLSCGTIKPFGTSSESRVYARPVRRMNAACTWVSANRYQFRFRIPAENITVIKTSAVGQYWVTANNPLQCSKTYQVDVRASFDGGATWCHGDDPYGDVCLFTVAACMGGGGGQRMLMDEESMVEQPVSMVILPNPNDGTNATLRMDGIGTDVDRVVVEIYDVRGMRVGTRTVSVSEGSVRAGLDLPGDLASGLYLVSVAAGQHTFAERLVIER